MIHKALEWSTLDQSYVNYVVAARKFLRELEVKVLVSEYRMGDEAMKVAGTLDVLGIIKRNTWVVDWKAVAMVPRTAGPQTAAYDWLYRRQMGGGSRPMKRAAVQLLPNGEYKLYPFEDTRDLNVFFSALNIWHFRNGW
jgi:hypothetical protein